MFCDFNFLLVEIHSFRFPILFHWLSAFPLIIECSQPESFLPHIMRKCIGRLLLRWLESYLHLELGVLGIRIFSLTFCNPASESAQVHDDFNDLFLTFTRQ